MLKGDGQRSGITHRADTLGNLLWVCHQAGADHVVLYPITRAAGIQVYFIVAPFLCQACTLCQFVGLAAAQLQGYWVLVGVICQKALGISM